MNEPSPEPDPDAARVIHFGSAYLLRAALIATVLIGTVGLFVFALQNPSLGLEQIINPNPIRPFLSLSGLVGGLASANVQAFLTLAVFVLVAAPIARVTLGVAYFRRAREPRFVAMSLGVLVLLLIAVLVLGPLLR